MKKAALYIRVSTQEQIEGYSIDSQKEKLINYCKAMDFNIYNIYIDPGYTGSNIKRPALQQIINDIDNIDIVIVYKLDRLSRSQKDTLHLIEDLMIPNNVDLISVSESFDTSTPFGRAMVGMLSVFAQLERENIRERCINGRIERAKDGLHNGSANNPVGYDYIDGQLIINEYEAMQIKIISDLYLSGAGIPAIVAYMKENGYHTKYGIWKSEYTANRVLFGETTRGFVKFGDNIFKGQHQAIIDEVMAAKLDMERKKRTKVGFKRSYLLSGFLFCKKCGARYHIRAGYKRHDYICYSVSASSKKMIKDPNCNNKMWELHELNDIIINHLKKLHLDKSYLKEIYNNQYDLKPLQFDNIIENKLKEVNNQITKLMDLFQFNDMPIDNIRERIESLNQQKNALENKLDNHIPDKNIPAFNDSMIFENLYNVFNSWNLSTIQEKRELLGSIIEKIELNDDDIHIHYIF